MTMCGPSSPPRWSTPRRIAPTDRVGEAVGRTVAGVVRQMSSFWNSGTSSTLTVALGEHHTAWRGTHNFDNRSIRLTFEVTALIYDEGFNLDL